MIKKAFSILITIAILGVIANDIYRYSMAQKHVNDITYTLTEWAQKSASSQSRDKAATALLASCAQQGIELTGYDQQGDQVTVTTRQKCEGTFVLGPIVNMCTGVPFKDAWDQVAHPFYVTNRRQMGFRV